MLYIRASLSRPCRSLPHKGWLLIFSRPTLRDPTPNRTRSNVRSVSRQPQVLAALGGEPKHGSSWQGKRPSRRFQPRRGAGLGKFCARRYETCGFRRIGVALGRSRLGCVSWHYKRKIGSELSAGCSNLHTGNAMKCRDLYIDLPQRDGG